MNFLCWLVGHQPPVYAKKGWYSPGEEYGRVEYFGTDGVGRKHVIIRAKCARCEADFKVARVHLP